MSRDWLSQGKRVEVQPQNLDIDQAIRVSNLNPDSSERTLQSEVSRIKIEESIVTKQECIDPDYLKSQQKLSVTHFAWDPQYTSDVIELTAMNRCLFLKEEHYNFRTVIANKSFESGIHYWEIIADARTENELKVGVCKNRDFDLKTAFSDYAFGWAYYCIG